MGDFAQSADRLIKHFGEGRTLTLRRHTETADKGADSVAPVVAETLTTSFVVDQTRTIEVRGKRETVRTLFLSGSGVGSDEPIDGSWTAQLPGEDELPVIGPIETSNPGGAASDWVINIRQGSARDV